MVYPPPPATGGISVTNEDLHCLNDGEFLNDVIIDFYLKWVFGSSVAEMLSTKTENNETNSSVFFNLCSSLYTEINSSVVFELDI